MRCSKSYFWAPQVGLHGAQHCCPDWSNSMCVFVQRTANRSRSGPSRHLPSLPFACSKEPAGHAIAHAYRRAPPPTPSSPRSKSRSAWTDGRSEPRPDETSKAESPRTTTSQVARSHARTRFSARRMRCPIRCPQSCRVRRDRPASGPDNPGRIRTAEALRASTCTVLLGSDRTPIPVGPGYIERGTV